VRLFAEDELRQSAMDGRERKRGEELTLGAFWLS
jgi:hypothetical protein